MNPSAVADEPDAGRRSRVCLGAVAGAHGLHGLVRVRPFTDRPEDVGAYGPVQSEDGQREFELEVRNRTGRGQVLVRIKGIDDRTAAEALKGERLFVDRVRLPDAGPDEFYHADLLGLNAVGADGAKLGVVHAVHNFGGGDMLEIADAKGRLATVPFTRAAVPGVDLAAGRITVDAAALLGPDGGTPRDDGNDDG